MMQKRTAGGHVLLSRRQNRRICHIARICHKLQERQIEVDLQTEAKARVAQNRIMTHTKATGDAFFC